MNKLTKIIILVLVISFLACFVIVTQAGDEHNTSGWAYSENIGWVSFNSTNCDSDGDGITDTGNYPQCPVGEVISNYGVNIDPFSGDLSGYAWSENIGWISFDRSDTDNPPLDPYQSGSGAIAKVNISTGKLTGWFRVLAYGGGWDGWYRLDHGEANEPYIDANGDWHGWAWTDLVGGWLSFNSSDPEAGGTAHNVTTNWPPSAINLSNTASAINYCSDSPANIILSWEFYDPSPSDSQSAYQVQVTRESDGQIYESDKISESASSIAAFYINTDAFNKGLGSNFIWYDPSGSSPSYTWRVKVWDLGDNESAWPDWDSFTTEKHQWPSVSFDWSPTEPSQDENVQFTNNSACYGSGIPCQWFWTFENGNPDSSSEQNPMIQFTSNGPKQVTLQVTDSDNNTCSDSEPIDVQLPLPGWQEILPW